MIMEKLIKACEVYDIIEVNNKIRKNNELNRLIKNSNKEILLQNINNISIYVITYEYDLEEKDIVKLFKESGYDVEKLNADCLKISINKKILPIAKVIKEEIVENKVRGMRH